MAKKQSNFFGPSSPMDRGYFPPSNSLARHAAQEPPSPRLKALMAEADVQNLTISGQAGKTVNALRSTADVHGHASELFGDTLNTIYETRESVYHKDAMPMVDEFTVRHGSMFGRQFLGILEVGIEAIGYEVARQLYVPANEPEQKGFLARLFGL